MEWNKHLARIAGLPYRIVIVTGIFNLAYVPSHIDTHTHHLATANPVSASASLFRWGALSEFILLLALLILPVARYRLWRPVNRNPAVPMMVLMVVLVAVSVTISIINVMHKLDVLSPMGGGALAKIFFSEPLNAAMTMHLLAGRTGLLVSEIFLEPWRPPFDHRVFKSPFLPAIFGAPRILGGFGCVIDFDRSLRFPDDEKKHARRFRPLPAGIGEIGVRPRLIIIGTQQRARQPLDSINSMQGIRP